MAQAGSAHGIERGPVQEHAVQAVGARHGSGLVQADEVSLDDGVGRRKPVENDAVLGVPGDDVPLAGTGTADQVAGGIGDGDAVGQIALIRACRIEADHIALDDMAGTAGDPDAVRLEAVDQDSADDDRPGRDAEAVRQVRAGRSVQFDQWRAQVTGLRRAVDGDGLGDRGQSIRRQKGQATGRDGEGDGVGTGGGIGVKERLAERARTVLIGGEDGEGPGMNAEGGEKKPGHQREYSRVHKSILPIEFGHRGY